MRAALIIPGDKGGHVEVRSVPDLTPSAGQVLVRVRASGLNRGEIGQAKGLLAGSPSPIGVEFAGEVAAVGANVSHGTRATASWGMVVVGRHNMQSPIRAH